ncbi:TPA: rhomboid family intramembrane serine protease [Enterococcus faecium]|uniref:rhomboid family intramembrane serine protease n=1 Tax=Enterococcus faecium TaxID=1352 RepID=UPI000D11A52A|nr:rhomboid family intramembrane serine protease [Enterococcus faecium]AWV58685.1 rhomboid family intramembrane serine protease [Enterococcus faecium]AWV61702.1 rhomboid family intramembrane serine protease [Enterococcus faecium]MBQ1141306.1 rhomboid family intramembrane serine protease [Enterococcus faecium]MCU1888482.1 rhomboid family intramembrane serine protease [Enterococcus faecium]MCU1924653.1 rhomboid family intramembrane serine protease [Enterococcus faecium]
MNYQQQIKLRVWLRRPLWTYAFLGIQTAVFLMMELFPRLEIPYYAGMYGPYLVHFNEWWRLVTPIFIHFGLMHFVMNSLILYFMGQQIEAIYGHWRFFLIYMFSGIMGNTASFAFNEANVLSGGASTSIFGLFGALFILGFHFKHNPAIQQLVRHFLLFIVLTFVFGLLDTSVDVWGHVGGLIGGLVLGNVLGLPKQQTSYSIHQRILSTLVFVFLFVICILLGLKKYGLLV